jgi:hypothetical protein
MTDEAEVAVIRAPSRPMAEMWAALLRDNGISCRLVPLSPGGSVYAFAQEDFEVRVQAVNAQRARELLPVD